MDVKFEAAAAKVESLRNEMMSKFEAVGDKIESVEDKVEGSRMEVTSRFDSLEARIPVMEKVAEPKSLINKILINQVQKIGFKI